MDESGQCGPSPRGWGKPRRVWGQCPRYRAIPTRVGKTSGEQTIQQKKPGHPHAGGENRAMFEPPAAVAGPSPRGWGKRIRTYGACNATRAIPTRVGKTFFWFLQKQERSGHPHAGGENCHGPCWFRFARGPSPRGWGKLTAIHESMRCNRAIPTRVGKTYENLFSPPCTAGHPHAGGENGVDVFCGAS